MVSADEDVDAILNELGSSYRQQTTFTQCKCRLVVLVVLGHSDDDQILEPPCGSERPPFLLLQYDVKNTGLIFLANGIVVTLLPAILYASPLFDLTLAEVSSMQSRMELLALTVLKWWVRSMGPNPCSCELDGL